MKNIKKFLFIILILSISNTGIVYAQVIPGEETPVVQDTIPLTPDPVNIHLTISTNDGALYDQAINVNACNSDNGATLELKITAYCAILQSGIQNDWNWDWAPGAFLNSLGDIAGYTSKDKDNNDVYHYWSWSLNNTEAMDALNQYNLQTDDFVLLNFVDPIEDTETEVPPPAQENNSSGGGSRKKETEKEIFDIKKAFEFLLAKQSENGSFEEELYTDWVAFALASGNYQNETIKLIKYLGENKTTGTLLTDYERRAMALMALGLNPYNTNGENYIEKIIASFDGKQFGDPDENNDDIFALIVLQNVGYNMEDKMINDDVSFILNAQEKDGSWNKSVDMTGAAIQALTAFPPTPLVGQALDKAKNFLKEKQQENGSWDNNASSTAWVMQGLGVLGENLENLKNSEHSPLDYLAKEQDMDGGIKDENIKNRIWKTSYVISALSGKSWNQIMQKYNKQENKNTQIEQKTEVKKVAKIKKTQNQPIQNTATVLTATDETLFETQKENNKKSWFMMLLGNVFSFF